MSGCRSPAGSPPAFNTSITSCWPSSWATSGRGCMTPPRSTATCGWCLGWRPNGRHASGSGRLCWYPSLRHVVTTAAAIATLDDAGAGPRDRRHRHRLHRSHGARQEGPVWHTTAQLHRRRCRRCCGARSSRSRRRLPDDPPGGVHTRSAHRTPIVVAANGPRASRRAKLWATGVMTIGGPAPGFEHVAFLAWGTVLDEGEDPGSDRVLAAAGPGAAVVYHAMWGGDRAGHRRRAAGRRGVAHGDRYVPRARAPSPRARGPLVEVCERDLPARHRRQHHELHVDGYGEGAAGRLDGLEAAGLTEVLYAPMGPTSPRAAGFAEMAGL